MLTATLHCGRPIRDCVPVLRLHWFVGGRVRRQIFPQASSSFASFRHAALVRSRREERYHCSFPLHRRGAALGCAGVALTSEAPIGFLPPDPIALKVVALAPDTA